MFGAFGGVRDALSRFLDIATKTLGGVAGAEQAGKGEEDGSQGQFFHGCLRLLSSPVEVGALYSRFPPKSIQLMFHKRLKNVFFSGFR